MTVFPLLLKFGLSPIASEHRSRIIKQKVCEEPPLTGVIKPVSDRDESTVVQIGRDYGLAFALLLHAEQFMGLMSAYSVLNLAWVERPA